MVVTEIKRLQIVVVSEIKKAPDSGGLRDKKKAPDSGGLRDKKGAR